MPPRAKRLQPRAAGTATAVFGIVLPVIAVAATTPPPPLAAHRAAYALSLADADEAIRSPSTPVAASGLIAYEFRGSACEGYTSSFRQLTRMERSEGADFSTGVSATSFEDGAGKSMRFRFEPLGEPASQTVVGSAVRGANDDVRVELTKPSSKSIDFGREVLFPTQHIERLIEAAREGGNIVQARVYDGSETGAKIFSTMTVIGKAASRPAVDDDIATLKGVRRWPVVISYFDETSKQSTPDYTLSFDLYENGVSGSLKLDYGQFALNARLKTLEILPAAACEK